METKNVLTPKGPFLQTFDPKKAFYFPVIVYPVCKPLNETGLLVFPRNPAKYREIRLKYFQIYVGKTYFILILAIRPVLFTPNVQIYLETSSLQRVNNQRPKTTRSS